MTTVNGSTQRNATPEITGQTIDFSGEVLEARGGRSRPATHARDHFDALVTTTSTRATDRAASLQREVLGRLCDRARSIPALPSARTTIPPRPESLQHAIDRHHAEAFRAGLNALSAPLIGPLGESITEALDIGREFHETRDRGGMVRSVATSAAALASSAIVEEIGHTAVGLMFTATRAAITMPLHAMHDHDEEVHVAARESQWERTRDEHLAQARSGEETGAVVARILDVNRTNPEQQIDWARMASDGDYNRAVNTGLAARLAVARR